MFQFHHNHNHNHNHNHKRKTMITRTVSGTESFDIFHSQWGYSIEVRRYNDTDFGVIELHMGNDCGDKVVKIYMSHEQLDELTRQLQNEIVIVP